MAGSSSQKRPAIATPSQRKRHAHDSAKQQNSENSTSDSPAAKASHRMKSRKHRRDDHSQSRSHSQERGDIPNSSVVRKETVQRKEPARRVGDNFTTRVDSESAKKKKIRITQLSESEPEGDNEMAGGLPSDLDDQSVDSLSDEEPADTRTAEGKITV